MQSVLLASQSKIKLAVVAKVFPPDQYCVTCVDCDSCGLPAQPYNSAVRCAKVRMNYAKQMKFPQIFDYYIAIENGILGVNHPQEVCEVLIEHKGLLSQSSGNVMLKVPSKYFYMLSTAEFINLPHYKIFGYSKTIGDFAHAADPSINSKNWIKSVHGVCRTEQIESSLRDAMRDVLARAAVAEIIIEKYQSYPNYHKPGVLFQDFFSIIREKDDIQRLLMLLTDQYRFDNIDYIVGPESCGFFGFGLSCMGNYGFIPLRMKGKLNNIHKDVKKLESNEVAFPPPGEVRSITYNTEYSTDDLKCPTNIPSGSRVVIFDDLIATGGSLKAACDLVEGLGCHVVDCVVLREVLPLREQAQKNLQRPYTVLLQD